MSATNKMVFLIFICAGGLAIAACQNQSGTNKTAATDSAASTMAAMGHDDGTRHPFGGMLNEVYTDKATFMGLQFPTGNSRKLVLAFSFENNFTQSLNGYLATKNGNDDDFSNKVITLRPGNGTAVPFGTSTNFGNLVLTKNEVEIIKDSLTANTTGVLFRPVLTGNFIEYKVLVYDGVYPSMADSSNVKTFAEFPVSGIVANPSPPRRYTFQ